MKDKEMTDETVDRVAQEAADKVDEYVKKTGRIGVNVSHTVFIGAAGKLADIFSAEDITVAAEMAAKTLKGFLEEAEEAEEKDETSETPKGVAGKVFRSARECAKELSEHVEKTGCEGVRTAYAAISETTKELANDGVGVEDIVIAEEMAARHDRGFLELLTEGKEGDNDG